MERRMSVSSMGTSSETAGGVEVALQASARELLKSRIFLARYVERRLVSEALGYRDLVLLSPAEEELAKDLLELRRRLRANGGRATWVGITDTSLMLHMKSGVCLWTEIDDLPLGAFWFQIRAVQFRPDEVCVRLKCLRHITDRFLELEPFLVGSCRKSEGGDTMMQVTSLNEEYKDLITKLKSALTIANMKDLFTFVFALIIAVATGSTEFINFLGNFILALLRELSGFIKSSTPLFLGFLDFFSKIVGGFYILLAMLFRQTSPAPSRSRQISYPDINGRYKRNENEFDSYPRDFD